MAWGGEGRGRSRAEAVPEGGAAPRPLTAPKPWARRGSSGAAEVCRRACAIFAKMSSPLYAVTVLDVARTKASFDLVSVCEAGCFTVSKLFAASLLFEPFWTQVYSAAGRPWPRPIVGPTPFTGDELIDWGASGPPPSEAARLQPITDVAYGSFRNVPPLAVRPDPDGLRRAGLSAGPARAAASRAFHDAVDAAYQRRDAQGLSGLPAAVLTVTVSDPRWVAHLERGMIWDGYGFDDEAPVVV